MLWNKPTQGHEVTTWWKYKSLRKETAGFSGCQEDFPCLQTAALVWPK